MEVINKENVLIALQSDPQFALLFLIENNLDAVYANLIGANVYTMKNTNAVYAAVENLLNKGKKALVLKILNVPVITENIPEGYEDAAEELGLYAEPIDGGFVGPPDPDGDTPDDIGDVTGDGSPNDNTGIWNGFFGMAEGIIVGLWGSTKNPNYDPSNPYAKSNTGLYVVIGIIAAVVALIFILKK